MENGTTLADSVGARGTWQTYLASDFLPTISYIVLPILVTLLFYFYGLFAKKRVVKEYGENLLLGAWSVWMPRMLHNSLFACQASQLIEIGYAKVRFSFFFFKLPNLCDAKLCSSKTGLFNSFAMMGT